MRKYTAMTDRKKFADSLECGNVFASSMSVSGRDLRSDLRARGLEIELVSPRDYPPGQYHTWRKHFAIWRVIMK